jgi:hypothetical protein
VVSAGPLPPVSLRSAYGICSGTWLLILGELLEIRSTASLAFFRSRAALHPVWTPAKIGSGLIFVTYARVRDA